MILRRPIKDLGVLVDGLGWIGKDVKLGSTRANEGAMRFNREWHTGGYNTEIGIKIRVRLVAAVICYPTMARCNCHCLTLADGHVCDVILAFNNEKLILIQIRLRAQVEEA